MKRHLLGILATGSVLMTAMPDAQAATQYYASNIILNGHTIASPKHIVAPDSGTSTSWIPLYYLKAALNDIGITSSWNGSLWNLNVPSSFKVDTSNPVASQAMSSSSMEIAINGTLVKTGPKMTAPDPAGGTMTTYVPIYYVMQVMTRMDIKYSWNGTNWTMTSNVSTGSGNTTETQQAMATAMWNVFNSVSWDVNTHPTMQQVGISPTTGPVTAGEVATWLSQWAAQAKGVTPTWGLNKGKYVPYSLQYEVSQNPYTWTAINGLWQNTDITSSSSVVTPSDVSAIDSNLQWWLTGDRVVNGVHHLHVPFYSNYIGWYSQLNGNKVSLANYQGVLSETTQYYDQITVVGSGTNLDMTLPNTSSTTYKLAWDIFDGNWEYGGWQATDNKGGKMIVIPNKGTFGPSITLSTLIPSLYLQGYSVMFKNANGQPIFSQPYSIGLDQTT